MNVEQFTYLASVPVSVSYKSRSLKPKRPKEYRNMATQTEPVSIHKLSHLEDTMRTFALPLHALENAPSVSTQKKVFLLEDTKAEKKKTKAFVGKKSLKPLYIKGNSQADLLFYWQLREGTTDLEEDIDFAEDALDAPMDLNSTLDSSTQPSSPPESKPTSTEKCISSLGGFLVDKEVKGKRTVATWTTIVPVLAAVPSAKCSRRADSLHYNSWIQIIARERGYVIKNEKQKNVLATALEVLGFSKFILKFVYGRNS